MGPITSFTVISGSELESFSAFVGAIERGWEGNTVTALEEIQTALSIMNLGPKANTFSGQIQNYREAVARHDSVEQRRLLRQIAAGFSIAQYKGIRPSKLQRFASLAAVREQLGKLWMRRTPTASTASTVSTTPAVEKTLVHKAPRAVIPPLSFEERVKGSVIGGAIGDALGHPTEFLNLEQIRERYGAQGVRDFVLVKSPSGETRFIGGTYTDDTQMTLAVANALLDTEAGYQGDLAGAFSRRFVEWLDSPDNNRAPGNACLNGCNQLKRGIPWYESGTENSKGCGAAMRVAPIGIVYHQQPEKLDEVALFSAILTHWHPTAYAAAIVGARLVAHALQSANPEEFKRTALGTVANYLPASGKEAINALEKIPQALTLPPDEAFALLGGGWVAEEAVAGALYAVLSTPNFEEAVLRAANTNGDSDSLAAIAGGIAGALYGLHAIPEKWVEGVENGETLLTLGGDLAELAKEVSKKDPSERVLRMHDPDLIKFPEIQRYSRDPQATVDLFVLMFADRARALMPFFNHDIWMDTRATDDDKVRISRRYRDRLIQSGQRHESEIVP
ncbi:MAG: ADP-ribosylglycohydrolase family protein, partial [Deltaproteobacteria bacterium]|nr:ADP-ribosylglycohydrolase family protein [Deltaproteobacteria bacterium]